MKKIMIGLLAVLLLATTGSAAVFAEGETKNPDPECIGEECEIAPYYRPCEGPDCMDLD